MIAVVPLLVLCSSSINASLPQVPNRLVQEGGRLDLNKGVTVDDRPTITYDFQKRTFYRTGRPVYNRPVNVQIINMNRLKYGATITWTDLSGGATAPAVLATANLGLTGSAPPNPTNVSTNPYVAVPSGLDAPWMLAIDNPFQKNTPAYTNFEHEKADLRAAADLTHFCQRIYDTLYNASSPKDLDDSFFRNASPSKFFGELTIPGETEAGDQRLFKNSIKLPNIGDPITWRDLQPLGLRIVQMIGATNTLTSDQAPQSAYVQTIAAPSSANHETYKIICEGIKSGPISVDASNTDIQTALETIGKQAPELANFTVGGAPLSKGAVSVTFSGASYPPALSIVATDMAYGISKQTTDSTTHRTHQTVYSSGLIGKGSTFQLYSGTKQTPDLSFAMDGTSVGNILDYYQFPSPKVDVNADGSFDISFAPGGPELSLRMEMLANSTSAPKISPTLSPQANVKTVNDLAMALAGANSTILVTAANAANALKLYDTSIPGSKVSIYGPLNSQASSQRRDNVRYAAPNAGDEDRALFCTDMYTQIPRGDAFQLTISIQDLSQITPASANPPVPGTSSGGIKTPTTGLTASATPTASQIVDTARFDTDMTGSLRSSGFKIDYSVGILITGLGDESVLTNTVGSSTVVSGSTQDKQTFYADALIHGTFYRGNGIGFGPELGVAMRSTTPSYLVGVGWSIGYERRFWLDTGLMGATLQRSSYDIGQTIPSGASATHPHFIFGPYVGLSYSF